MYPVPVMFACVPYSPICCPEHRKSKFLIASDASKHTGEFQHQTNPHHALIGQTCIVIIVTEHWSVLCNSELSLAKYTCVTQIPSLAAH